MTVPDLALGYLLVIAPVLGSQISSNLIHDRTRQWGRDDSDRVALLGPWNIRVQQVLSPLALRSLALPPLLTLACGASSGAGAFQSSSLQLAFRLVSVAKRSKCPAVRVAASVALQSPPPVFDCLGRGVSG